jgi:hypothetical protein
MSSHEGDFYVLFGMWAPHNSDLAGLAFAHFAGYTLQKSDGCRE